MFSVYQMVTRLVTECHHPFQIIMLIQFMKMIFDRIIYLKMSMIAKYIYQVILVIALHVYLFIIQPYMTGE